MHIYHRKSLAVRRVVAFGKKYIDYVIRVQLTAVCDKSFSSAPPAGGCEISLFREDVVRIIAFYDRYIDNCFCSSGICRLSKLSDATAMNLHNRNVVNSNFLENSIFKNESSDWYYCLRVLADERFKITTNS